MTGLNTEGLGGDSAVDIIIMQLEIVGVQEKRSFPFLGAPFN
jgi:hypothetical protein